MTLTAHNHHPHKSPDPLEDILWLAELEREQWKARLRALRLSGVPLNDGEPDPEPDQDSAPDPDAASDSKPSGDDDGDDDPDEDDALTLARKAAAKANGELKRLKKEQEKQAQKASADAGKWQELYEAERKAREDLETAQEAAAKRSLVEAELAKQKALNPSRAARLLDLDDIEDQVDAERAIKLLVKSDPYLFDRAKTKQMRSAGNGGRTRDVEPDDDDKPKRPKESRLRAGIRDSVKPRT